MGQAKGGQSAKSTTKWSLNFGLLAEATALLRVDNPLRPLLFKAFPPVLAGSLVAMALNQPFHFRQPTNLQEGKGPFLHLLWPITQAGPGRGY